MTQRALDIGTLMHNQTRRSSTIGDLNYPRVIDHHLLQRSIFSPCLNQTHPLNDAHPTLDSTENGVLAVQPWCRCQRDEELAPIGVRPAVSHAQHSCSGVLQGSINLVLEFVAIYRAAASTCPGGITRLNHEVWNYAMKDDVVVVPSLGEIGKVLAGFRSAVIVKLDNNGALRSHLAG
jgi:hypothetical protein